MANVFHIAFWIETDANIDFTLGSEGAIATREAADQVAEAYREFFAGKQAAGALQENADTRVGILELPEPHPRFGYKPPLTDVSTVIIELRRRPPS